MITIKEMADIVGVSQTTVSNVIHGKTKEVSKETINKINKVIEEHNYIPNMSARALAQNSSKIIGVIIRYPRLKNRSAIEEPFNGEITGALESSIRNVGYYMMLYCPNEIEGVLNFAATWNVDGLIILGLDSSECQIINKSIKKPIVFIDCYFYDDGNEYINVGLDDKKSAYDMTKYLIEQGHKRIGFFANNRVGVDEERWKGFLQALQEYDIQPQKHDPFLLGQLTEKLEKDIQKVCNHKYNFTALFFSSDYFAVNAINFLNKRGIKVPEDISIAGFDDNIFAKNANPRLTTVCQDPTLKGKLAVKQLMRLINDEPIKEKNVRLPTKLAIRDSVKKLK